MDDSIAYFKLAMGSELSDLVSVGYLLFASLGTVVEKLEVCRSIALPTLPEATWLDADQEALAAADDSKTRAGCI